jgi:hypothetical protein
MAKQQPGKGKVVPTEPTEQTEPEPEAEEVTCAICGEPGVEGAEHAATDEHGIHDVTAEAEGNRQRSSRRES